MTNHALKVLLIDDDPNIRRLVEYNLELDGFIVFSAPNSAKGMEFLNTIKPDLILLDIMMSGADGFETLDIIKNKPELAKVPVFMLTAKTCLDDVEKAFSLGADDYIAKPFDPSELADMIKMKLAKTRN